MSAIPGFNCTGGSPTNADTCEQVCGDNIATISEECDDGNRYDNDGCSSSCNEEDICADGKCPEPIPFVPPTTTPRYIDIKNA